MASIRSGIGEDMEDRYLFKAKSVYNGGKWVQGYLYGIWEKRYILWGMTNDVPNMIEVDPTTICQCTGLKDKNGNLIWENDIIKTFDAGEEWCLSKIIFADTSLGYGWKTTDIKSLSKYNNNLFKEVSFGSFDSKSVEVVGNIFDNPKLLESE